MLEARESVHDDFLIPRAGLGRDASGIERLGKAFAGRRRVDAGAVDQSGGERGRRHGPSDPVSLDAAGALERGDRRDGVAVVDTVGALGPEAEQDEGSLQAANRAALVTESKDVTAGCDGSGLFPSLVG